MHRLLPIQTPTGWWSPRLSPRWVRFWGPLRRFARKHWQKIPTVEVRGLEHLRHAVDTGHGVLIAPNHVTYSDPLVLFDAGDQLGRPFYFMTAWQVFATSSFFQRWLLRQHGCFSVDREGSDVRAFRQAVDILQADPHPLVVFPEGEMYHVNDRVMPFREGPAAMAFAAARRAERPIACVPCAIKYYYLDDPTPRLHVLADQLERALFWRPRPGVPLEQRISQLAAGALALKEIEYLGQTSEGTIAERIRGLAETILQRIERDCPNADPAGTIPDRVKTLRQHTLQKLEGLGESDPQRAACGHVLDDLFLVVQLFCYPGDYIAEKASIERIAETFDKFEEDILGVPLATIRGLRRAIVSFGEPLPVDTSAGRKGAATALTRQLEERVQSLLDAMSGSVSPQSKPVAGVATTGKPGGQSC